MNPNDHPQPREARKSVKASEPQIPTDQFQSLVSNFEIVSSADGDKQAETNSSSSPSSTSK